MSVLTAPTNQRLWYVVVYDPDTNTAQKVIAVAAQDDSGKRAIEFVPVVVDADAVERLGPFETVQAVDVEAWDVNRSGVALGIVPVEGSEWFKGESLTAIVGSAVRDLVEEG